MTIQIQAWVVLDEKGDPLGIDQTSGGYPWTPTRIWSSQELRPDGIKQVEYFQTKAKAQEYAEMFGVVHKATLTLEIDDTQE